MVSPQAVQWGERFLSGVASNDILQAMLDPLDDVVFSIKDRLGRYVLMSEACVNRCGLQSKEDAIGQTAFSLFPGPMAERYARQDDHVFRTGRPLSGSLDLTLYSNGNTGWCLTTKQPLCDRTGRIIGLACVSRDLVEPSRARLIDSGFAETVDHMHEHYAEKLLLPDLAHRARISEAQFERRMKRIFQLSAGQYLMKLRIGAAAHMLEHDDKPISEIALAAGFFDQSLLTRAFRRVTGFTPGQYRRLQKERRQA